MDLATAQEELKAQRRQLFDLRIQKERGEVKDTRQFAKTKADIARLLYHIGELHHAEAVEAEGGLEPRGQRGQEASPATIRAPRRRAAGAEGAAESPARVVEPEALATTAQTAGAAVPLAATEPQTTPLATPELPATTSGSEDENA
jgi:large subunit ribosomal protein L29